MVRVKSLSDAFVGAPHRSRTAGVTAVPASPSFVTPPMVSFPTPVAFVPSPTVSERVAVVVVAPPGEAVASRAVLGHRTVPTVLVQVSVAGTRLCSVQAVARRSHSGLPSGRWSGVAPERSHTIAAERRPTTARPKGEGSVV
jgi:hypothetical protein